MKKFTRDELRAIDNDPDQCLTLYLHIPNGMPNDLTLEEKFERADRYHFLVSNGKDPSQVDCWCASVVEWLEETAGRMEEEDNWLEGLEEEINKGMESITEGMINEFVKEFPSIKEYIEKIILEEKLSMEKSGEMIAQKIIKEVGNRSE